MKNKLNMLVAAAMLSAGTAGNAVEVPNQFSSGGTASASEVNQNFNALADAINSNGGDIDILYSAVNNMGLVTQIYFSTSDGNTEITNLSAIVIATCPEDTLLVGGSVACNSADFDSTTTNFGVVSISDIADNSIIGACSADALLFRDGLYGPPVTANAVCLSYGANTLTRSTATNRKQQGQPSLKALEKLEQAKNHMSVREQIMKDRAALQSH